jgi:hypothetical protein
MAYNYPLEATDYVPIYTVDSSVTDTALTAAAKVFSAIKLAVAAAEAAVESDVVVQIMPRYDGVFYTWDGADSGYVASSSLTVNITAVGAQAQCGVSLTGSFPAPHASVFPVLTINGNQVTQTGSVTIGEERQLRLYQTNWYGAHFRCTLGMLDFEATDSDFGHVNFYSAPGGYFAPVLIRCTEYRNQVATTPSFENVTSFIINGGIVDGRNATFGVAAGAVGVPATMSVVDVTVLVDDSGLVGAYNCFDSGVGGAFNAKGVTFNLTGATSAVKLFNATATLTQPVGVTYFPAPLTLNTAPPASAALVTVPLDVRVRKVFGDVTLTPAAGLAAFWTIEVETGIATGVYSPVLVPTALAAGLAGQVHGYSFDVPAGRRYRFTKSAGAGTTETISHYSFID